MATKWSVSDFTKFRLSDESKRGMFPMFIESISPQAVFYMAYNLSQQLDKDIKVRILCCTSRLDATELLSADTAYSEFKEFFHRTSIRNICINQKIHVDFVCNNEGLLKSVAGYSNLDILCIWGPFNLLLKENKYSPPMVLKLIALANETSNLVVCSDSLPLETVFTTKDNDKGRLTDILCLYFRSIIKLL